MPRDSSRAISRLANRSHLFARPSGLCLLWRKPSHGFGLLLQLSEQSMRYVSVTKYSEVEPRSNATSDGSRSPDGFPDFSGGILTCYRSFS